MSTPNTPLPPATPATAQAAAPAAPAYRNINFKRAKRGWILEFPGSLGIPGLSPAVYSDDQKAQLKADITVYLDDPTKLPGNS